AMVTARDGQITDSHIRFKHSQGPESTATPTQSEPDLHLQSLDEVEAAHVQRVLQHTGGHKGKCCEILGISRPALDRKIQKYALKLPERD
ncbi:MAG: helix-turn-helix domain-containing protein, partial [Gammaproteobacteria bacterium]|nr:helix-turn-helix domain-containing protein [Gammaproteobacteria bacterium]